MPTSRAVVTVSPWMSTQRVPPVTIRLPERNGRFEAACGEALDDALRDLSRNQLAVHLSGISEGIAAVGGAEDGAARVPDAPRGVAVERDHPLGIIVDEPLVAASNGEHLPAAVGRAEARPTESRRRARAHPLVRRFDASRATSGTESGESRVSGRFPYGTPIWPPSVRVITIVADRGRLPASPGMVASRLALGQVL